MSGAKQEPYVNEGLQRWEEMRAKWRTNTNTKPRPDVR